MVCTGGQAVQLGGLVTGGVGNISPTSSKHQSGHWVVAVYGVHGGEGDGVGTGTQLSIGQAWTQISA